MDYNDYEIKDGILRIPASKKLLEIFTRDNCEYACEIFFRSNSYNEHFVIPIPVPACELDEDQLQMIADKLTDHYNREINTSDIFCSPICFSFMPSRDWLMSDTYIFTYDETKFQVGKEG